MAESPQRPSTDGSTADARRRPKRRVVRQPREPLRVGHIVRLAARLALYASLIGPFVAWPLALPASWLASGDLGLGWVGREVVREMAVLASPDLEPLSLKATVFLVLAGLAAMTHLLVRLIDRAPAVGGGTGEADAARRSSLARLPFVALTVVAMATFPMLSAIWPVRLLPVDWAPEIGRELIFAGGSEAYLAWSVLAAGVVWFFVAEDQLRQRWAGIRLIQLVLALGIGLALLIVGDDAIGGYRGVLDGLFVTTPGIDGRGGPLGSGSQATACLALPVLLAWARLLVAAHRGNRREVWRWAGALTLLGLAMAFGRSATMAGMTAIGVLVLTGLLGRRAGMPVPRSVAIAVPPALLLILLMQAIASRPTAMDPQTNLATGAESGWWSDVRVTAPVVLWPTLRQNLLLGTGLSTFPMVHAESESRFALRFAESAFRSARGPLPSPANEYLRLLVEGGLVTLGLLAAAIGAVGIIGWKALRRTIQQADIAVQLALVASLATLAAMFLVDSPLRAGPVGLMLLLVLALWQAGDRLWRVPVPPLDERDAVETAHELHCTPVRTVALDGHWFRLALALVVVALAWAPVLAPTAWSTQRLLARALVVQGDRLVTRDTASPVGEVEAALGALRLARLLDPMAPDLGSALGWAYREMAERHLQLADAVDGAQRTAALRRAQQAARTGLDLLEPLRDQPQTTPERARVSAFLHELLANASSDPAEAAQHHEASLDDLRLAARLDPAHPRTLVLLHERLMADNAIAHRPELDRLRRTLYRFHPGVFDESLVGRVERLRVLLEVTQAADEMRTLLTVNTADPVLMLAHAATSFESGTPEGLFIAKELAANPAIADTPTAMILRAQAAVRDGNLDRALEELDALPPPTLRTENAYRLALQRLTAWHRDEGARREDPVALRTLERSLSMGGEPSPELVLHAARIALIVFQEPTLALSLTEDHLLPAERSARARALIIRARALMTLHPSVDLAGDVPLNEMQRADFANALEAYEQAHDCASVEFDRRLLRRRVDQLRRLLALDAEAASAP